MLPYKLDYTAEEKEFLEDHNVKLAIQSVCRFCGECKATCPNGVDIPSLMRTHNYAMGYGNLHMTRITLGSIPLIKDLRYAGIAMNVLHNAKTRFRLPGESKIWHR